MADSGLLKRGIQDIGKVGPDPGFWKGGGPIQDFGKGSLVLKRKEAIKYKVVGSIFNPIIL